MNRDEAQRERDRMAAEHPEATWLIAERPSAGWEVVRVALQPPDAPIGSATEARPKPDYAEDPRTAQQRNIPYPGAG